MGYRWVNGSNRFSIAISFRLFADTDAVQVQPPTADYVTTQKGSISGSVLIAWLSVPQDGIIHPFYGIGLGFTPRFDINI
jgi:hypothetical protein